MQITIKHNLDQVRRVLGNQEKQIRFAAARALTQTVQKVRAAIPDALEKSLDRPTPFTKSGTFIKAARRDDLSAVVGFKDRQASYLKWQISGGVRAPGAKGIKLPGNIKLNTFGNIPRGVIDQLKAAAQGGGLSRTIARRLQADGNRRKHSAPVALFLGKPTGKGWENAPMGIWRRVPGNPGKLIPVVIFADRPARYRPRFNFLRLAEDITQREFAGLFSAALRGALATAR